MKKANTFKLPIPLLILDGIGSVLVGIGLAEWLAGTNLIPAAFRFEHYPVWMMVLGILLMVPALHFFIRHALGKQTREI